jgi:hypothetical protein
MNYKIHQWARKGSSKNNETVVMAVIIERQKQPLFFEDLIALCSLYSDFLPGHCFGHRNGYAVASLGWRVIKELSMRIQKQCFSGESRP